MRKGWEGGSLRDVAIWYIAPWPLMVIIALAFPQYAEPLLTAMAVIWVVGSIILEIKYELWYKKEMLELKEKMRSRRFPQGRAEHRVTGSGQK